MALRAVIKTVAALGSLAGLAVYQLPFSKDIPTTPIHDSVFTNISILNPHLTLQGGPLCSWALPTQQPEFYTSSALEGIDIPAPMDDLIHESAQTIPSTEAAPWIAFEESNAIFDLADAFPLASIVSQRHIRLGRVLLVNAIIFYALKSLLGFTSGYLSLEALALMFFSLFIASFFIWRMQNDYNALLHVVKELESKADAVGDKLPSDSDSQLVEVTSQVTALELRLLDATKERDERTAQTEDLRLRLLDAEKAGEASREQLSQALKQNTALSQSEFEKKSQLSDLRLHLQEVGKERDDRTSQLAKLQLHLENIEKQKDEIHQDLTQALEKNVTLSQSQLDQTSKLQDLQLHLRDVEMQRDVAHSELTQALEKNSVLSQSQLDTTAQLQDLHLRVQDVEKERDASRDELTHVLEKNMAITAELSEKDSVIKSLETEKRQAEQDAQSARVQRDLARSEFSGRLESKRTALSKLEKEHKLVSDKLAKLESDEGKTAKQLNEKVTELVKLRRTNMFLEQQVTELNTNSQQTIALLTTCQNDMLALSSDLKTQQQQNARLEQVIAQKDQLAQTLQQDKAVALDDLDTIKQVLQGNNEQLMRAVADLRQLERFADALETEKVEAVKAKERAERERDGLRDEKERLKVKLVDGERRIERLREDHDARLKAAEAEREQAIKDLLQKHSALLKDRDQTHKRIVQEHDEVHSQAIRDAEQARFRAAQEREHRIVELQEELASTRSIVEELELRAQDRDRQDLESQTSSALPSPPQTPMCSRADETEQCTSNRPAEQPPIRAASFTSDSTTTSTIPLPVHDNLTSSSLPSPSSKAQGLEASIWAPKPHETKPTSSASSSRNNSMLAKSGPSSYNRALDALTNRPKSSMGSSTSSTRSTRRYSAGATTAPAPAAATAQVGVENVAGGAPPLRVREAGIRTKSGNDLGKHFNHVKRRGPQSGYNMNDYRT